MTRKGCRLSRLSRCFICENLRNLRITSFSRSIVQRATVIATSLASQALRVYALHPARFTKGVAMKRKKIRWSPQMGGLATYVGSASTLARGGYNVRGVAEACGGRMVVEAIGRSGTPVRFTVKSENLAPLQPGFLSSACCGYTSSRKSVICATDRQRVSA